MIYHAKDPVCFCGDLHGNFQWLKSYLEKYNYHDCSIVFCGDVGLGFQSLENFYGWIYRLKLKSFLRKRKIDCYFVRGNHDNPAWFDDKTLVNAHLKAVSDYSVIATPTHSILCIGGEVSVDRIDRKYRMSAALNHYMRCHHKCTEAEAMSELTPIYWENEISVYDEQAIDNLTFRIDVICSHGAPTFLPPFTGPDKSWFNADKELEQDCREGRQILTRIYDRLIDNQHDIKYWFYGHYHHYETYQLGGLTGNLLDMARDGNLCIKELDYEHDRSTKSP